MSRNLSIGTRGEDVAAWQRVLNAAGISVVVDGIFGDNTLSATISLQHRLGVTADGIVGPLTITAARAQISGATEVLSETGSLPGVPSKAGKLVLGVLTGIVAVWVLYDQGILKRKKQ